ncbi:hypothetical protein PSACC_00914 [Paramicrosporidium saccamoebae]|uniref:tRNA(Ile)-lysidine/2-thiocytidine synthase N-terminal domain-containing protein n=1 Tax=Paramicrosporidium saccamoebae TaxID=1246581 RepID=A0A2H9TNG4_9FUNG|nr:hypothetical protein PSACC_00914 [Paramicrosporidium saccamoebae]
MAVFVQHNFPGVTEDEIQIQSTLKSLDVDGEIMRMQWEPEELEKMTKGQMLECLRERRHRALLEACRKNGIRLMLTGHNLDDDIVTMMYRMSHGSGTDGLAGMKSINTFPIVDRHAGEHFVGHPLLEVPKERLHRTCEELGLQINRDQSNEDRDFSRNALQGVLSTLQSQGFTSLERLQEALQFFKQIRCDMHQEVVPIINNSVAINRRNGDVTLVLNNNKWLSNQPLATRVISLLASYAGARPTGLKTSRLVSIRRHLLAAFEAYREDQRKLVNQVAKRTGMTDLQPFDLTRRAVSTQATMGGAVFYPMSRTDGLRRLDNVNRTASRKLKYGTVFLVQREPPTRIDNQKAAFRAIDVTLRAGESFLWDNRFYLSYQTIDPADTTPRHFQISYMTVADVRQLEALTAGASTYRRNVYSYMGSTPGSHLYQVPVVREVGQSYLAFPTLKAQFPMRYEWEVKAMGDAILMSRLQCLP